jgi:site-specific recombinase XerD
MVASTLTYWRNGNPGERCLGDSLLTEAEVQRVLQQLRGGFRLLAEILYGTGLRLEEVLALRVRDVAARGHALLIRDAAGEVRRTIQLAPRMAEALVAHQAGVRKLLEDDLVAGQGAVLPADLDVLYPLAGQRWCWQFVFPSAHVRAHAASGRRVRSHLEADLVHRVLAEAGRAAGLRKPVQTHSLRHAFAARLVSEGVSVDGLQRAMGHANRSTTLQYFEVLNAALESARAGEEAPARVVRASQRPPLPAESRGWTAWAQMQPGWAG